MSPEDSARWTPVENSGSMKQAASPQRMKPGPMTRSDTYDQSRMTVGP